MSTMEKLLLVFACAQLTQGLVNAQCDETTCTVLCYPVHWQRDLCVFYEELNAWRETVASCGLTLPPLPSSRPGVVPVAVEGGNSPTEQWRVANQYWEEVVTLWQGRFDSATPLPPDDPTPIGMTTDFDDFFSGSGSGNDITTDLPTMPTTAIPIEEPATVVPELSDRELWDRSNQAWEDIFTRWAELSRQGAGLGLPTDVDVSAVIDSYMTDERDNREAWSQLAGFWQENSATYESSYGGVCPEQ